MRIEDLVEKLAADPVMRAKFLAGAIKFYEELGVEITEDQVRLINDEALRNLKDRADKSTAKPAIIVWPSIF